MKPSEAIERLRSIGLTEAVIAQAAGTTQPTVNRIRRGITEPGWTLGQSLVSLARRVRGPLANPGASANPAHNKDTSGGANDRSDALGRGIAPTT